MVGIPIESIIRRAIGSLLVRFGSSRVVGRPGRFSSYSLDIRCVRSSFARTCSVGVGIQCLNHTKGNPEPVCQGGLCTAANVTEGGLLYYKRSLLLELKGRLDRMHICISLSCILYYKYLNLNQICFIKV